MAGRITADKIVIEGVGNVGTPLVKAVAGRVAEHSSGSGPPILEVRDSHCWGEKHADAGLIGRADVGSPKPDTATRHLKEAGWPADRLRTSLGDVRDQPRGAYRDSVTLGLTDSFATKHDSICKSLQADSPAIAIGLGTGGEAVVEFYVPGKAGFCCVHGSDENWCRRQPCLPERNVSTTEMAPSREVVLAAAELATSVTFEYLTAGNFPGGSGVHFHNGTAEWFSFGLNPDCDGPHDPPFIPNGSGSVRLAVAGDRLTLDELLGAAGPGACYADRNIASEWRCDGCGRSAQQVHTVHPAAACLTCGSRMRAGLGQVSGLTASEITELGGHPEMTLAEIGLADETILRCLTGDGDLVWIELLEEGRDET